jgi:hypothetical protein
LLSELWQTSPITTLQSDRQKLFPAIQEAADNCSNTVFKSYLAADNTVAAALEKSYPILEAYNSSFDRVLNALKSDRPAQGEVFVYMLYNMGYVIKTADGPVPSTSSTVELKNLRRILISMLSPIFTTTTNR